MTVPIGTAPSDMIQALADQRIEQIEQTILSSANLVDIITKYNLYEEERKTKPITDIIKKMQKKVKVELVSTELSNPESASRMSPGQLEAIAFTLTFSYGSPLTTQQVTNELVTRFLDEDLKRRHDQAKATTDFLNTQITTLEASMAEQEKRIADFRAQHPDNRPEALAFNQQMAATTYQNILAVQSQLASIDKTRGDLRTQIASVDPYSRVVADGQLLTTPAIQLKALQGRYMTLSAQYGASHPDLIRLRHQIEALQDELGYTEDTAQIHSQLIDARTNLASAEHTLGPHHPDVVALKKEVAALEDKLATTAHDPTVHDALKKDADNPAYLMLMSQLKAADEQYKSLSGQLASLQTQYARYQENVANTPGIEQEFATLSRDYDNAQLRYRELKEKKMSADMTQQMEVGRKGERMAVVEPPELPTDTFPKRIYLLAAGIFLSLVSGFGGVMVVETMSRSVHGARHLQELTGMSPLVIIPYIFTREERERIKRRRIQLTGASAASIALLAVLFSQFVMPLDVLWSMIALRLGFS